jgi:hypothetical protein
MSHQNLSSGKRSGEMIRENGRNTMIRKAYWGVLASMLVALAFATGCSSTSAMPPVTQITTITIPTADPAGQNAVVSTKFGSPLIVLVSTNGTPVSGVTVTFSAPPQSIQTTPTGTFSSTAGSLSASVTTDSTGTATSPDFYANVNAGTYVVTASAVGTTSSAQFSMFNTLQPVPISVSGGSPQSTSAGQQFNSALSVVVKDSTGAVVGQGLPVTFTNTSGDGTFADSQTGTTTAITNPNGVATAAPFVAGSTVGGANGQYTVTATTIDGDANSATFTLSNTIVPAAIVAAGSSTPQSAAVNTPFAPLTVTVWDATTPTPLPVAGAVVTFSAPAFTVTAGVDSTSSGTFPGNNASVNVWTDANGVATAPTFTANGLAGGPYNVSATVVVKAGSTLSVNFVLTNQ